jgi:hypothetical protein
VGHAIELIAGIDLAEIDPGCPDKKPILLPSEVVAEFYQRRDIDRLLKLHYANQ